jgi:hypothetical protein
MRGHRLERHCLQSGAPCAPGLGSALGRGLPAAAPMTRAAGRDTPGSARPRLAHALVTLVPNPLRSPHSPSLRALRSCPPALPRTTVEALNSESVLKVLQTQGGPWAEHMDG